MNDRIFFDFGSFLSFFQSQSSEVTVVLSICDEDRFFIGNLLFQDNFLSLDGENLTDERFLSETENYGLFASNRNIVIYKADSLSHSVNEMVMSYLGNPNPYIRLLIFVSKKELYDDFIRYTEKGVFLDLFTEKPYDRDKRVLLFFRKFLKSQGVETTEEVLKEFMSSGYGMDRLSLLKELEKLVCFLGVKKKLEKTDLRLLFTETNRKGIWDFKDSILKRKLSTSLFILNYLLMDKYEDPLGIIAFLRNQMLFGIRLLDEKNFQDKRIHLFKGYGLPSLKKALTHLFYAEENLKSGFKLPLVVMESLTFRLTS
ncbi:MAG: hypothetical protein RRZ67_03685 [Victivallaceae bacterium]